MREEQTDLWIAFGLPGHRVAISTNGFVKRNGEAVMGRGCAAQAARRWPLLPRALAQHIRRYGNVPGYISLGEGIRLMVLPVKHNWWEKASPELILNASNWLNTEALLRPDVTFHVPRLGCGNGKLGWINEVRPIMEFLPDNVAVHS